MTADYKQLAEELYEALKAAEPYIYAAYSTQTKVRNTLQRYEELKDRGTGRTTALYMKAITEALENSGKTVEFIDHHPHRWDSAHHHASNLMHIIKKLGYDIVVTTPAGSNQVFLYNRFGK
jgi:hypothetical protein